MSCDDMYVCEDGVCLPSCRIKIQMGKCDKFQTLQEFADFMQKTIMEKQREKAGK